MNLFSQPQNDQQQTTNNLVRELKNTFEENRQIRRIKKCINPSKVTEFDRLRLKMIQELKRTN